MQIFSYSQQCGKQLWGLKFLLPFLLHDRSQSYTFPWISSLEVVSLHGSVSVSARVKMLADGSSTGDGRRCSSSSPPGLRLRDWAGDLGTRQPTFPRTRDLRAGQKQQCVTGKRMLSLPRSPRPCVSPSWSGRGASRAPTPGVRIPAPSPRLTTYGDKIVTQPNVKLPLH